MDLSVKQMLRRIRERNEFAPKLQLVFLKRLYQLLKRGYSLNGALEIVAWDEKLTGKTKTIRQCLYQGKHLDEALAEAKFHRLIVMYIYFVRINGDLLSSLKKSIHMFEQRLIRLEKFKRTSRYPLFLFIIFLILLLIIRQSILPSYIEIFRFHAQSHQTVLSMLFIFNLFITAILIGTFLTVIAFVGWKIMKEKLPLETQIDFYTRTPLLRHYVRMQTSFYFATYVGLFLKTGLSMKQIIEHLEKQEEFPIIRHYASVMLQHLNKGQYLDTLLHSFPLIDPQLADLFKKHNHIEELEKDLAAFADFLAEELEYKTRRAIMFIQPATFLLLGIFIIIIYVSLLWPMFQLLDSI